ncbi:MAG: hypothetical protein MPJ50_15275 [Pirellulales bacterium]|nr:hypothetical protein [Pirellulales bacterium]
MNEINFLPVEYRKKSFDRKDQRRHALIVGLLFLVIGASYTYQHAANGSLSKQLVDAQELHRVTLSQFEELDEVEAELVGLAKDAAAVAYLDHPWPQSQVVALVVDRVPPSITLKQLRVVRVPRALVQRRSEGELPTGITALARDETLLRERYDTSPYEMIITGLTQDHVELHQFMIALDRHSLVSRAELTSLDGVEGSANEFEFAVTCLIAPGYGVPDSSRQEAVAGPSSS